MSDTPSLPSSWSIATSPATIRRAARVALIVGIVIAAINHGDKIIQGDMDATSWLKCALTFFVPYCVSTHAAVNAVRSMAKAQKP